MPETEFRLPNRDAEISGQLGVSRVPEDPRRFCQLLVPFNARRPGFALSLILAATTLFVSSACSSPGGHENRRRKAGVRPISSRMPGPVGMVAIDDLARRCGLQSGRDTGSQKHWLRRGNSRVEIRPGSRVAYIEGELALMKAEPELNRGRLYIPRAFATKLESWSRRPALRRHARNQAPRVHTPPKKLRPVAPPPRRQEGLAGMTFVIDPGHGGKDPGAVAPTGLREKTVALDVSNQVSRFLRASGAKVVMTRDRDVFISLNERAAISNRYGPVAFVSIHANSTTNRGAKGIEVFRAMRQDQGTARDSSDLARAIYRRLESVSPHSDRGVKPSPGFRVLRKNDFPAVLVELGFLSHRGECELLEDDGYRRELARAVADGIADYGQSRRFVATR